MDRTRPWILGISPPRAVLKWPKKKFELEIAILTDILLVCILDLETTFFTSACYVSWLVLCLLSPRSVVQIPPQTLFFCTFFAWHVHALLTSTTTMMDHELNAAYVALADHVSDGAPCHGDPPWCETMRWLDAKSFNCLR